MPRRRTGAAVPGASGAQSLLKAVFGKRAAAREPKDECDPVQFPSRFTRRLQLEEEDQQEEVDDADEGENKSRLISQVMELQNTLQDLSNRVGNVGGENGKLKTENAVLCEYIDRLMQASAMFNGEDEDARSSPDKKNHVPHSSGSNLGAVVRCTARVVGSAQSAASTPASVTPTISSATSRSASSKSAPPFPVSSPSAASSTSS